MLRTRSWWLALFPARSKHLSTVKARPRRTFRRSVELLEERIVPALITIDTTALTISDLAAGTGQHGEFNGTSYTAHWFEETGVAEFDFAGDFTVAADDVIAVTGLDGRSVRIIVSGDVSLLGSIAVPNSSGFVFQIGGAADLSGTIDLGGTFSVNAERLDVSGTIRAATVSLETQDILNIASGASVVAAHGGALTLGGSTVINSGSLLADGLDGGRVEVSAANIQNSGTISADGMSGMGGVVAVSFTGSYIETSTGLLSADGTLGSGGSITVDGGSGSVFTSGRQEARGAGGGQINIRAGRIDAVAASEDVSGSVGAGGSIFIYATLDAEYSGTLSSRGVSSGGFIEVSAAGTLTYSGTADAGATHGEAGTLLLDPKNLIISSTAGTLPQYNFVDPNPNTGGTFGRWTLPLSTGNVLVVDPTDNFGGTNAGAAYLFNGFTGALISSLVGSANDKVGGVFPQGIFLPANVDSLTALSNGNFVISSPSWNGGKGAVTWGSGTIGVSGIVSSSNSVVGSSNTDAIGYSDIIGTDGYSENIQSVTALENGNYVILAPKWSSNRGAVTWGNGVTGTSGIISASNSLVGTTANDRVGAEGVIELESGNYLVTSVAWNGSRGAVTWGSGTAGVAGAVSATNSLVGTTANDRVGAGFGSTDSNSLVSNGVLQLSNGNYVVMSSYWNGSRGAVTWGNGTTGIVGPVSSSNSLVGSSANDGVGGRTDRSSITELTNGNYVVVASTWGGGKGAVTWGSGTAGVSGVVSSTNSLVGTATSDQVGYGGSFQTLTNVLALSNGNYLVTSPNWNSNRGAVTWANGSLGVVGTISTANSLIGAAAGDMAGYATPLSNGNYVVQSYFGGRGSSTLANGTTGLFGTVGLANSLVGSAGDSMGSVTDLLNGNYVVSNTGWGGTKGAVTFVDGRTGLIGTISASNSLVGSNVYDSIGNVTVLANGNYVVTSSSWNSNRGSVTWGSGLTGVKGVVASTNSLVGTTAGDYIGESVYPLSNGNYVAVSRFWQNSQGAVTWGSGTGGVVGAVGVGNSIIGYNTNGGNIRFHEVGTSNYIISAEWANGLKGAVTWGSGTGPTTGVVSDTNSLVGTRTGDQFGSLAADQIGGTVVVLSNGNYVVLSQFWNRNTGAVIWGNGNTGVKGQVTSANAFVGTQQGDMVGYGVDTDLNDNPYLNETLDGYLVYSLEWNGGARALTWFDSSTGRPVDGSNNVSIANSITGNGVPHQTVLIFAGEDQNNGTFVTRVLYEGTGRVTAAMVDSDALSFGRNGARDISITPSFLTQTLKTGTSVVLQADNDILVNSPITVNNPSGNGGSLTLQAGRSILFAANSGITTDNGDLTLIANDVHAIQANRSSGSASITAPANSVLNVGTGTLTIIMGSGPGATGSVSLGATPIAGATVFSTTTALQNLGATTTTAGQAVNFRATVTPVFGSPLNGGTVQIVDVTNGNAVVATPTLLNGVANFTIDTLSPGMHNLRAVYVGNTGSLTSQSVTITQTVNADTVLTSPTSTAVNVESLATFTTLSALSSIDVTRWQVSLDGGQSWQPSNSAGLPDTLANSATGTTLSFTVGATQNGYQYRALFTNPAYPIDLPLISEPATLTARDTVLTHPADQAGGPGLNAVFTAASGYATDAVRWQVSTDLGGTWSDLPGANSSTLTLTNIIASQDGNEYRAVFTPLPGTPTDPARTTTLNGQSVLISNPAFLTFGGILLQPTNQNFAQTVSFTADSGRAIDTVRWMVSSNGGQTFQPLTDGGPYSGSLTKTLTITGTTTDMLGNVYRAVFTNPKLSVTTNSVTLIPASVWDADASNNSVAQGAVAGQAVGLTVSTELNNGAGLTYSLSANASGRFVIDPTSGVVTVAAGATINSLDQAYVIQAVATDPAGNTVAGEFTINITSTPPAAPVDQNALPNAVLANSPTGTPVGITAVAADPNPVTYSLSNSAGGRFKIDPQSGVVMVADGTQISYPDSYTITVLATAAGGTSSSTFTVLTNSGDVNALTIGGYSLLNPVINGTSITGTATLPIVGSVTLTGTVQGGQYLLSTSSLSPLTINGLSLTTPVFKLSNSGLTLGGTFTNLPVLGTVQVTGSISSPTDFKLNLQAPLPSIGGLTLTGASITASGTGFGLTANVNIPSMGNVALSGSVQDSTHYSLTASLPSVTLNSILLTKVAVNLTASGVTVSGTASLPLIGTVTLAGSLQNGQYSLSASVPQISIAGFKVTGGQVTLSSSGISFTGNSQLPVVNNGNSVSLSGTIQDATHYSFSASVPNLTLGGFSVTNVVVALGPTGLTLSAKANLPLVNNVNLTGSITTAGNYNLTATIPSLPAIGGFQLTTATITLTNTGLALSGTANLPIFGTVTLSGLISDANHYSISFTPSSVNLGGGFTLNNPRVNLSPAGLSVVGDADLPILGTINKLQGTIQDATHFTLSAPLPNVSLGQFSLKDATITLAAAGGTTTLSVTGTIHLPLFNDVQFTGVIDSAGNLSLSTPLPSFSLPGGFIKFTNNVLTLYPDRVHVEADLSVAGVADAHFVGDIYPNGEYELAAYASLKVGGFEIPIPRIGGRPNLKLVNGELDIDFDYSIPGLDAFLPAGDSSIEFSGSYSLDGRYSLTATANYTFTIGPVVVTQESLTLTNDSLTIAAHGSIANLGPLAEGDVSMTIYKDGSFMAMVMVNSSIAGINLGNAQVTFGNHNPDKTLISTLHAEMSIPGTPTSVLIDGYWDSNGNYEFTGSADLALGGLTLAQAQFELSKQNGLTFSAEANFGVFTSTISGSIVSDENGGFTTTTDVTGTILGGPNITLHGSFDSHGNYNFTGEADVVFGPLTLSQASFTLNNQTGLTFASSWNLGVFQSTISGNIRSEGAGFVITVDAMGSVFGQALTLHGEVHSNGRFDLSGQANVNLPLFNRSGQFEFTNKTGVNVFMFTTGLSYGPFAAASATGIIVGNNQSYDVTIDAQGSVFGQTLTLHGDIRSNGKFALSGTANVGLQPLFGTSATFELSNYTGANVFKFTGQWSFGPFASSKMTGTIINVGQSFKVTVDAEGKVFSQALTLHGDIGSNGKFDLSGTAKLGLQPFVGSTATFSLSNNTGATIFKFLGSWNFTAFTSSLTATIVTDAFGYSITVDAVGSIFGQALTLHGDIQSNGRFSLSGSANVGLAPLLGTRVTFGLSNTTGATVFKFTGSWSVGAFASSSLTGTIIAAAGGVNVTVSARGTLLGNTLNLGGTIYSDGKFNLQATNNLDLFGVSLGSVVVTLRSDQGFNIQAQWGHTLFSGKVSGTIGTNGRVILSGSGGANRAGFGLNVSATIDLDPARNSFSVGLQSNLDVYVANVAFTASAHWSAGDLPSMSFTGRAAIGGVLSKVLSGYADFTINLNSVRFVGNLSIPYVGASLPVSATIKGNGELIGIPHIPNLLNPGDLLALATDLWFDLGASFSDAAKGLNKVFNKAGSEVADLLKNAGALPGDMQDALSSAFGWSNNQISGYLSSAGGALGAAAGSIGGVLTGKKKGLFGVPGGSLVFFDANFNHLLDTDEAWGYTSSQGEINYRIPVVFDLNGNGGLDDSEGQWVLQGGIDLTTGLTPPVTLISPASWAIASPLTTIVAKLIEGYSLTMPQAIAKVALVLNVPGGVDLKTFDPVAAALAGDPNGRLVENTHAQVENTVALIAALFRTPFNAPSSMALTNQVADVLVKYVSTANSPLMLTDSATIATLIQQMETETGINLSSNLVTGVAAVIANCNEQFAAISHASGLAYLEGVAQIKTVVQSTVANDIASTAAGQLTIPALTAKDTGASLVTAIAAAQTPPKLLIPINIVAPATSANGATVSFSLAAFDLAGQPLTVNSNFASGAMFPMGTTTVTANTVDSLGNATSATFTVTVADTTAPNIVLPSDLIIEANAVGGANVTLPTATATDAVDAHPVLTASLASGFFQLGTTPVVITATDSAGNTTVAAYLVTVVDRIAPALTVPLNLTIEANTAGGAFLDLPQAVATDVADTDPLITVDQTSGFFPIGTTVVNVTVIDASGNSRTRSFAVTVVDTIAPAVVTPANLIVEGNAFGGAEVTLPDVFAFDDGDDAPDVDIDRSSGFFPLGTTTVHFTVTDASGNSSSGSYTITVVDTTAPVLDHLADLEIQADTIGGANVTLPTVTVSEAVDANPTISSDHSSGFYPLGTTVIRVTTVDAAGNRSAGSYTLTVVNRVAPTFGPPSDAQGSGLRFASFASVADSDPLSEYNIVVEASLRGGAVVVLPTLTATSAADAAPLVRLDHSSGFFPVGVTVITATATDSSGNVTTGTFTVTVLDTTPPVLTVPLDILVEANRQGGGAQVTLPAATAFDIADPGPTLTYSKGTGVFAFGVTVVQVTARDASGNEITASFKVTVADTTPPAVTPPANITVTATSASGAQVTLPASSVSDLVDAHPTVTYDHPSGQFPIGTTLVTARATDASGNTTLKTFTVTVNPLATTVTLQAGNPSTSTYGDALSYTVMVSATGGATIPDGEIVYLVDASHANAIVGSGMILNGSATVTVAKLNAGSHSLVASYSGNLKNAAGQSAAVSQTVNQRSLTLKALTSIKGYDGTTSSPTLPVVIGLQPGDTMTGLAQHYTDANLGYNKTLVPSGSVEDGNSGNNYVLSFVNNVTGTITISLNGPSNSNSNVQPTFTGTGSSAAGDATTVTVNIYSGPLATGQPLFSLPATLNGGQYSVLTVPSFTADGIFTAQAVQETAAGQPYLSVPVTFNVDTTPPVLALPPTQTLTAIQNAGVTDNLAFTATAQDQVTATPTITYKVGGNVITPDYVFPVGQTTVTVTAVDAAGNQRSGTFSVVVTKGVANEVLFEVGSNATLTAVPPGGDATVRWQTSLDGIHFTDIPGATSNDYHFVAELAQTGRSYRALFSRTSGVSSSIPSVVTVTQQPSILDAFFMLPENSGATTVVGTVTGTETGETLTYSFIDGNAQSVFSIDPATGKITVANSTLLDFETHPTWPLVVQVTDRFGQSDTAIVTINLTNVNEAPSVTQAQFSLVVTAPNGTAVGTVQASDPDAGDSVTFSITGGNSSGAFAINPQTGAITVADRSQLNVETHPTFSLTIQAADGHGATGTAAVTITLTGLNTIPVLSVNGPPAMFIAKVAKGQGPVRIVPSATVVDPDVSTAFKVGGGQLVIYVANYVQKVSKKGKVTVFDSIGGSSGASALGTTSGPMVRDGRLWELSIQLHANTTTAAIQAFLRGLSFTTKGIGLKQAHRAFVVQLTDAAGATSNDLQQTVNVSK